MDLKKAAMDRVMKLAQNPKVMRVAMNPKVMGTVMKAISLRSKVSSATNAATQSVARTLNLATREEVRELKRTIRKLEENVARMEKRDDDGPDRGEG